MALWKVVGKNWQNLCTLFFELALFRSLSIVWRRFSRSPLHRVPVPFRIVIVVRCEMYFTSFASDKWSMSNTKNSSLSLLRQSVGTHTLLGFFFTTGAVNANIRPIRQETERIMTSYLIVWVEFFSLLLLCTFSQLRFYNSLSAAIFVVTIICTLYTLPEIWFSPDEYLLK